MRIIALVGVIGVLLLDLLDVTSKGSVGGPLTLALMFLLAMLAVGIHDAWSNKRGGLGWIVSIVCSLIGGFLAVILGGLIMEEVLPRLNLGGPLATSSHPLRYVAPAGVMALTILGSWAALQAVNRLR
jgi:hypothetical protein